MMEIQNTANYFNSVKKYRLAFRQWGKFHFPFAVASLIVWSVVFYWVLGDFLKDRTFLYLIFLTIIIGSGITLVYSLIMPIISYRKNFKYIKNHFATNKEYEVIYYFNRGVFSFAEAEKHIIKYSDLKSITYKEKENAILFRKSYKFDFVVVLLDDYDEKTKEELFSIIQALKKK